MGVSVVSVQSIGSFVSRYRWPLFIGGILLMSIAAQGIMVYFATRPSAPRPVADYYDRALEWDAEKAALDASAALGWTVAIDVPVGAQYVTGMPRPVDVRVVDPDGAPVRGLAGRLVAVRPADTRLNVEGTLTELPQEPGRYRALLRLDAVGLWELGIDARQGELRFVHRGRFTVPAAEGGS